MSTTSVERLALAGTLGTTFEAVHGVLDQWFQSGWAAVHKSKHGDEFYELSEQIGDNELLTPHPSFFRGTKVTGTQLGQLAATHHVAIYTAGQLVASIAATRALGYRVPLRHLLVGHVVINGVTHWKIDRRAPLHRLAKVFRKDGYIEHSQVVRRPGSDPDMYGPGTATFELDQSVHRFLGWAAAITTAYLATRRRKR